MYIKDLSFVPLRKWGLSTGDIFLSAGPCSAESEKQVLKIAKGIAGCGISFMRAGLWKPRTHPGSFEGVGTKGLKWLVRAREEYNLPIGIEVATPEHVEACLKHKVDVVWIGARTTTNPFAVQAEAGPFFEPAASSLEVPSPLQASDGQRQERIDQDENP